MSKLLVIIGITGLQGSSVAKVFQNESGWRIRGITRNPSKYEDLQKQGIELVEANLDDQASLERAFDGANAIYAITDFWQFLNDPSTFETAAKEGKKPNEIAMEREVEQGKKIIRAAAGKIETLDRLVLSTLSDTKKWTNGEIKSNLHFDGKAMFTDYLKEEYPSLAAKTSYLQMGFYLSNWRMGPHFAPQKQEDGTFVIRKFIVNQGKPIPFVDPPNDTGHFVRALILSPSAPAGSTMLGYAELIPHEEYNDTWARVLGVQSRIEQVKYEDMVKLGMPEWLALEISESGIYTTKYGWTGGDPEVKGPEELGVDMSKLTKVEDWIKKEDWSSVL